MTMPADQCPDCARLVNETAICEECGLCECCCGCSVSKSDAEIRRQAIDLIEALYPPDSPYDLSIGQELLERARRDCSDWRNEPTPILVRLAQLNREMEENQIRQSERKRKAW